LKGEHAFSVMRRPGRQNTSAFLGAEMEDIAFPAHMPKQMLRAASFSAQVALVALQEAWAQAWLSDVDPTRIGLIVGTMGFSKELGMVGLSNRTGSKVTSGGGGSSICGGCSASGLSVCFSNISLRSSASKNWMRSLILSSSESKRSAWAYAATA
jgi:hypothetical protein